jgi:hypothetical protein
MDVLCHCSHVCSDAPPRTIAARRWEQTRERRTRRARSHAARLRTHHTPPTQVRDGPAERPAAFSLLRPRGGRGMGRWRMVQLTKPPPPRPSGYGAACVTRNVRARHACQRVLQPRRRRLRGARLRARGPPGHAAARPWPVWVRHHHGGAHVAGQRDRHVQAAAAAAAAWEGSAAYAHCTAMGPRTLGKAALDHGIGNPGVHCTGGPAGWPGCCDDSMALPNCGGVGWMTT